SNAKSVSVAYKIIMKIINVGTNINGNGHCVQFKSIVGYYGIIYFFKKYTISSCSPIFSNDISCQFHVSRKHKRNTGPISLEIIVTSIIVIAKHKVQSVPYIILTRVVANVNLI